MSNIIPPTSLDAIISLASSLNDNAFDLLEELLSLPTSTDPSEAELQEVADRTGEKIDDLRYFLSFLSFLFSQTSDIPDSELESTVSNFLEESGTLDDTARLTQRLVSLLAFREIHSNAVKKARLVEGLLPNIVDLANFVDTRSDFARGSDGKISGTVTSSVQVVQLAIRTNSADPSQREVILQLDERAIDKIQETIDEIREKISILTNGQA